MLTSPLFSFLSWVSCFTWRKSIDLPTSKQLIEEIPGHPQRLNSLPISMAVSPDKRYVVTMNAGYGTFESHYEQSLAVLDTQTGSAGRFSRRTDRPRKAKQTLYSGLAFSRDGSHIYASMASLTDPTGDANENATGSGIVVYSFNAGKIAPERFIKLPLDQLAEGHKTRLIDEVDGDKGVPYPAAIAVVGATGAEKLLVAENLTDDVLLIDPASGALKRSSTWRGMTAVPSAYPIALAI